MQIKFNNNTIIIDRQACSLSTVPDAIKLKSIYIVAIGTKNVTSYEDMLRGISFFISLKYEIIKAIT